MVNAAGAWAAPLARLAGIDLPVSPLRRFVAATEPTRILPQDMPMTIFVEDGFHLRVRDDRVLMLWPDDPLANDPADTSIPESWFGEIGRRSARRIPAIRAVTVDRAGSWGGLYEMSPDRHAILGASPALDNFIFSNGSSGHGVMHAPAIGQLISELILDGRASIDITPLRLSRFEEGAAIEAAEFL